MGRPLKKDINGTDVLGLANNGNTGILVSGYFGGTLTANGYSLIKQRGANTFVVAKTESFTADTATGTYTLTNMSDQVEVTVGDEVSGTGIPTGTRVVRIDSATQVTISKAATATNNGVSVYHFGAFVTGTLVDTTPNANGEIQMMGFVNQGQAADNGQVPIRKITRRIAYGFPSSPVVGSTGFVKGEDSNASTNHDQAKYTWVLQNDSSTDYIALTPITIKM